MRVSKKSNNYIWNDKKKTKIDENVNIKISAPMPYFKNNWRAHKIKVYFEDEV